MQECAVFYEIIRRILPYSRNLLYFCSCEVTKIVYFIGNEHMLIAHDSNRLRFS